MRHDCGGLQSTATGEQRAAKLYSLLELGLEASADDIRTAYRRLARIWHPDRHRGQGQEATLHATLRFQEIAAAYEVLNDPERRRAYDLGLIDLLDVEDYLKRFQDLTLTANGLGMSSRESSSSSPRHMTCRCAAATSAVHPDGVHLSDACGCGQPPCPSVARRTVFGAAPSLTWPPPSSGSRSSWLLTTV